MTDPTHQPSQLHASFSAEPTVRWHTTAADDPHLTSPLVVLLHGRGSHEGDIIGLADHLPPGASYVAVRAPIAEGGGFAWFANRGIGRPLPESLADSTAWFTRWLDRISVAGRPVILVGFSGGATFAGGVVLADPGRFAGLASLYATLPFEAGVPTTPGRLDHVPVLLLQGTDDTVIPVELQTRTWDYIHNESGATVLAHRAAGGHSLTSDGLEILRDWIDDLIRRWAQRVAEVRSS